MSLNKIFSAPIDSLNDLFEAEVLVNNESFKLSKVLSFLPSFDKTDRVKGAEFNFITELNRFVDQSKSFGIYSLSRTPTDELLWAHYANSHHGFCIEYDLELLLDYKLQGERVIELNYTKRLPKLLLSDLILDGKIENKILQKIIGTKSIRWKYEKEIRIVTGKTGFYEYDFRALKGVYFGHRCANRVKKLVMRVMRGRGINYYQIQPISMTYKLRPEPIEDIYANAKKYKTRIALVEKGVPFIDEKLKPYEIEARKAIEIARREPYCEKVYDVYLSSDRGTKENPVFFVSYKRSDGLPRNFYYSLDEIKTKQEYT